MSAEAWDRRYEVVADALASRLYDELTEVYMLLGELRLLTQWPRQALLERLGCDASARDRAAQEPQRLKSDADRRRTVGHCLDYLGWLVELGKAVDLVGDRREVVIGAFELCDGAGGPLDERVQRCRTAFEREVDGSYSAMRFLRFGELGQAWAAAALQLEHGRAYDRARRVATLTGAVARRGPHIHPDRLRHLHDADAAERFGVNVFGEMRRHVRLCESCKAYLPAAALVLPAQRDAA